VDDPRDRDIDSIATQQRRVPTSCVGQVAVRFSPAHPETRERYYSFIAIDFFGRWHSSISAAIIKFARARKNGAILW